MKVMAVGPKRPLTPEQRQKYLPTEVPNTLKLYLDGKIEQFWYRQNSAGVAVRCLSAHGPPHGLRHGQDMRRARARPRAAGRRGRLQ
jgi:hypothetical protein